MTEAQLLAACLRNEATAQTAFYDYFKKRVWAVCRRYTRTTAEADDVLQEVFVKLFKNLKNVSKPESLGGWVRQITVRVAVDYYRANWRESQLMALNENIENSESQTIELPLAIENLSYQEMLNIIQGLPKGYQMVLNLYVIDGYNHSEIGQMLGIGEGTSRSQLSRAKEIFRRRLEVLEKKTMIEIHDL